MSKLPRFLSGLSSYLCLLTLLFSEPFHPCWAQTQSPSESKKAGNQAFLDSAVGTGNIDNAKIFLKQGADVNGVYPGVDSPLRVAAQHDNIAMVRFLIESGANVNAKDPDGRTALLWAASYGYLQNVLALIQAGANVNAAMKGGATPLAFAIGNGHTEVVSALLKAGAKLEGADDHGPSALAIAAWGCHADTVHELLKAGAQLAASDWKKDRPPQFSDFPVQRVYHGKPAPIDFNSNPQARAYRTRLKQANSGGPDFAGHYTVAQWGCGSNCQAFTFIDVRDGAVIDGVTADRGADYRLHSELFIENPADSADENAYEDDPVDSIPVDYYVMRDGKLSLVYSQACRVSGNRQQCGCEDLQKLVLQSTAK